MPNSAKVTEEQVVDLLRATPDLSVSGIREKLGLPAGKRSSNRVAYLLMRLDQAGQVEIAQDTSGVSRERNRIWRIAGTAPALPSALVVVSGDYDPLTVARATPRTPEAAVRLKEVSCIANDIARGYDQAADYLGSAIRIQVGLIPSALDEPELVPACVRRMLVLMEDIDFEVLDSHNLSLGSEYSMFFTIRCHPD